MDVRDLDIDLIDSINPFGEAYSILAKTMNEESLKRVAAIIAAKKVNLTLEEARELAARALKFKTERGRLPQFHCDDPWERRMAEGVAFLHARPPRPRMADLSDDELLAALGVEAEPNAAGVTQLARKSASLLGSRTSRGLWNSMAGPAAW